MREKSKTPLLEALAFALIIGVIIGWAFWSIDPFNSLRLSILASISFSMLPLIFLSNKLGQVDKVTKVIIITFVLLSISIFLVSKSNKVSQFFGIFGRNTGLLLYLSLCITLVSFYLISSQLYLDKFVKYIPIITLIPLLAGFLQIINVGPSNLISINGSVFSIYGNTNFYSAFLGIVSIFMLALLFEKKSSPSIKSVSLIFILICLHQIYESNSIQGFFIFFLGASVFLYFILKVKVKKIILIAYGVFLFASSWIVTFGFLNLGPLSSKLYNTSMADRGYCWSSALRIWESNPFFGVGFDTYQDWFRRTRSFEAIRDKGINGICDSAHNVFLDFLASGGIFYFLLYVALVLYTIVRMLKVLRNNLDYNFLAISAAWCAYQVQSFISINHITLATIGWALTGLILGYKKTNQLQHSGEIKSKIRNLKMAYLLGLPGILLVVLISLQPQLILNKYKNAYDSGSAENLLAVAKGWPNEMFMMNLAATRFRENNLLDYEYTVSMEVISRFPDSYSAWRSIYNSRVADQKMKLLAKENMLRLDPLNSTLK
jgi:O-antigen ligase